MGGDITDIWSLGAIVLGAVLLVYGAELFTDAAIDAARALRLTTAALGLLVAGAEPEELVTAVFAAIAEADGIAVGDVIGTNVTILSLCLGIAAVLAPIRVDRASWRHGLIALAVGLPGAALLASGGLGRVTGAALVSGYAVYVWYVVRRERIPLELEEGTTEELATRLRRPARGSAWRPLGVCAIGLTLVTAGGVLTVSGAEGVARMLGWRESAVGLTLVALATSAEMIVLAVVPALKGHPELTLGGIVGSYAYNLTLTLGAAAAASPLTIDPKEVNTALGLMLALLLGVLVTGRRGWLGRATGVALVAAYGAHLWLATA